MAYKEHFFCFDTPTQSSLYIYIRQIQSGHGISNSCNKGMRAFPDMYARLPEGHRPEGKGHTYQAKPVLQLICNTYQADSLYRVINHPSQYECRHWMYYICIPDCGSAASTFWLCSLTMNGHILEMSQRILATQI